jgi:hypothetical protein
MSRTPLVLMFAALLVAAPAAHAASSFTTIGPHFGFSSDPSQLVFGGHLGFGNVAPDLDFVPSLDVGVGDNVTVISVNGDFHYRFHVSGARWQPYAGAGVALHTYSYNDNWPHGVSGGSDTVGSGNLVFGADVPTDSGSRFYVEGRLALADGPTFKALAGWSFKLR